MPTVRGPVVIQSGAVATGNGLALGVDGLGTTSFRLGGTFVATITFEATNDQSGATGWVPLAVTTPAGAVAATTATAAGTFMANVAGLMYVRARVSAYVSGAVTVTALATDAVSGTGGGGGGGGGGAVTIADGADVALGSTSDTSASPTVVGRQLALLARLPASLGQKTMAASLAVVLASDQAAIPVTGAAGTQYAEDSAHVSGDTGTMALAVRNDAGTALAGTTGDYIPLTTDSSGALRVTGGGGGTQYAEDAAHTSGDSGTMALAVRNDGGTALAGTSGDYIPLTTDSTGALRVTGGGGGTQYAEDAAHVSGDLGTLSLAVRNDAGTVLSGTTGDYTPLSTDSSGNLRVTLASGAAQFAEDTNHVSGDIGTMALAVRNDSGAVLAGTTGDYIPLTTDATGNLRVTTNTQHAEDAAHTSGDLGTMALAVRNDAGSVLAGTTGDYIPLTTDSTGALRVVGGSGSIQFAEDSAHASGDMGTLGLAVRNDAATALAGTTGDYIPLTTDASGNLRVTGAGGGSQFAEDAPHSSGDLGTLGLAVRNDAGTALAGTTLDYIPLTTDSSGYLRVVNSGPLPAGGSVIGKVSIDQTTIGTTDRVMAVGTTTILVVGNLATGGTYAIGDFVGPSGGLGFAVNPANRATGLGGHIESFIMIDGDSQGVPCDVYFFENSNWTSPSDNAAWSTTDTSAQYNVGRCAINSYTSFGAGVMLGYGTFDEGPIPYHCNGQTLYFAIVTRGTPTYTATRTSTAGLQFRIGLALD